MKWQILILLTLTFILGASLVSASSIVGNGTDTIPDEYVVFTVLDINFSFQYNNTYDGNISFEFAVWNRSSIDSNFTKLFGGNITNNTFYN